MSVEKKCKSLIDLITLDRCSYEENERCVDKIKKALIKVSSNLGYTYARYVYCRRADIIKNEDTFGFYVSSFPEKFEDAYRDGSFGIVDPMLRYTAAPETPDYTTYGTWQGLKDMALADPLGKTKKEKQDYQGKVIALYELCESYNIKDGAFVVLERNNDICWFSMGCDISPQKHNKRISKAWVDIKYCAMVLDNLMVGTTACQQCHAGISVHNNKSRAKLSDKQISVLKTFYAHPSAKMPEIADLLSIEVTTVNYHLANIRETLGVAGGGLALATFARDHGIF